MPNTTTLACSSQKGGVGKTTTTLNLGAQLALWGARVCIIDFDPQGQSGTGLGLDVLPNGRTICAALTLFRLGQLTDLSGFLVDRSEMVAEAEGSGSLAVIGTNTESMDELSDWVTGSRRDAEKAVEATTLLRRFISTCLRDYDYVLIDTPPTTNQLNALALAASDYVIGVAESKYASFSGIVALRGQTEKVPQSTRNTCRPVFMGTLLNETPRKESAQERHMRTLLGGQAGEQEYDEQTEDAAPEARTALPEQATDSDSYHLFDTAIRASELISSAYATGRPAVLLYPNRPLAEEYSTFAQEVFARINEHRNTPEASLA
ncbi:ParA family protein [Streptomyces sp. NPDC088354]|uniref:ParA family protein n=1 Tax=Streptomyces sp. NPDC088354 TaxID=3365856 RepID=UPI00382A5130